MSADTDVVDLLLRQHEEIRDLFFEVQDSTGDDRRNAFQRLVRLLAVHETAEEEIVHPLARRAIPSGQGIVEARLREERETKELLAALDGLDTEDPAFLEGLTGLREAVFRHARAEEKREFPKLREVFGDAERRAMATAVRAAEAAAPTHPHPGTEGAAKNLLIGPAAAIADRTRDLIRAALEKTGR